MYQALYRKWRPRRFDDVVGQQHITETLKRQVETGRLSHAYLFTGTRGTGKTSCAKILSKAVNCEAPEGGNPCNTCPACLGIDSGSILDVLELDAASNNGVDQVRALRDEAVYTPAAVRKRVYIIDEVHMLSTAAFNALLKILEEPPSHLMFILATTELHKVPATIKSRCQQFSFKRIRPADIVRQLHLITEQEGIRLTGEASTLLARLADGGLRDALSLLDQCIDGSQELGEKEILDVLGLAGNLEIARLMELIIEQDTAGTLAQIGVLYRGGKDMGALIGELSALVRDLLIRKTAPSGGEALLTGGYEDSVLLSLSGKLTNEELVQMLSVLQTSAADLYRSSSRRTDAELCAIRLCQRQLSSDPQGLAARISRLEEQLVHGLPHSPANKVPRPEPGPVGEVPQPSLTEDSPPWEPASPLPDRAVQATSKPPEAPPAPDPEHTAAATQVISQGSGDWQSFVSGLRGKIPPSAYTFLAKPSFAIGVFDSQVLTIFVDSDMTKTILNKPEIQQVLERESSAFAGRLLRIQLQVGMPEPSSAPNQADDKLNDLLKLGQQFGNITIK